MRTGMLKAMLSLRSKRVLVVDDFVTNTSFHHMRTDPTLSPYHSNVVGTKPSATSFGHNVHIVDPVASKEMQSIFEAYNGWLWT
jgi:hypothetical protein